MPAELAQWLPPAVIVALMLYLHRTTQRRLDRLEDRMDRQIGDLRQHVDHQMGDLRDRMGRIEGTLDVLRQFFVGSGRDSAA